MAPELTGAENEPSPETRQAAQSRLFAGGYRQPEELTILSLGLGQDSTALVLKILNDPGFRESWAPGRLACVFADTGNEHPHTHRHLEHMKELCASEGGELHVLEAGGEYHSEAWPDLVSQYRKNDTVGSKAYRKSCSVNLKINPIYRWLEALISREYGTGHGKKAGLYEYTAMTGKKIRAMIGIAAGEERRIAADKTVSPWMEQNIERVYPLIGLGWDREACKEYIRSLGYQPVAPSLCRFCPYKTKLELMWTFCQTATFGY